MRSYDEDADDDLKELNAAPWQVALLMMNPEYCCWGPHEDYMAVRGEQEGPDDFGRKGSGGWHARVLAKSWADCGFKDLDDLNEVVNFYFQVTREAKDCEVCVGGHGYHPDAQWISESFYKHSSPFKVQTAAERESSLFLASFGSRLPQDSAVGRGGYPEESVLAKYPPAFREFCEAMRSGDGYWCDKITHDEVGVLLEAGRLIDFTSEWTQGKGWQKVPGKVVTADEVNAANRPGSERHGFMGHDGINRGILIEQRCKRLGVPASCDACRGSGSIYTAPSATVNLILWVLHPRKGCSRGVEIQNIQEAELPEIFAYLRKAAARNAERFSKIPG